MVEITKKIGYSDLNTTKKENQRNINDFDFQKEREE